MASEKNYRTQYVIPDNFIDEGRIFKGMFRTRYFVEAVVLALIGVIIGFLIPVNQSSARLSLVVICAGPFFLVGIIGINGDPVSVALGYMYNWLRNRSPVLYDDKVRVLVGAPVDKMMNSRQAKEIAMQKLEEYRQQKLEEAISRSYVEGEDFRFARDTDAYRDYVDPETQPHAPDWSKVEDFGEISLDDGDLDDGIELIDLSEQPDISWEVLDFLDTADISIEAPTTAVTEEMLNLVDSQIKKK